MTVEYYWARWKDGGTSWFVIERHHTLSGWIWCHHGIHHELADIDALITVKIEPPPL